MSNLKFHSNNQSNSSGNIILKSNLIIEPEDKWMYGPAVGNGLKSGNSKSIIYVNQRLEKCLLP